MYLLLIAEHERFSHQQPSRRMEMGLAAAGLCNIIWVKENAGSPWPAFCWFRRLRSQPVNL